MVGPNEMRTEAPTGNSESPTQGAPVQPLGDAMAMVAAVKQLQGKTDEELAEIALPELEQFITSLDQIAGAKAKNRTE